MLESTYELDGDVIKFAPLSQPGKKPPDRLVTLKIKTLTDKEMILEDKKDDKTRTSEFKRK